MIRVHPPSGSALRTFQTVLTKPVLTPDYGLSAQTYIPLDAFCPAHHASYANLSWVKDFFTLKSIP